MATNQDVLQANRTDRAAWVYDPAQVKVETRTGVSPKSSAAKLAGRVRDGERELAADRDQVVGQLQAERKRRKAERAKTAGLSTADILAARRLGTG